MKKASRNNRRNNRRNGKISKNRNNTIRWTLIGVLSFLGLSPVLTLVFSALWMIGSLPADQVMTILRKPASLLSNWQLWMTSGYGLLGFRYLVSLMIHDPILMGVIFLCFIAAVGGLVLVCKFFWRLNLEKNQLCIRLENSSLQTERRAKKTRLAADPASSSSKARTKTSNLPSSARVHEASGTAQPSIQIQACQEQFPLLGIDASLRKKEEDDLSLAGRLMQEKQEARQQYENIFHQASSKLSALYFLFDDLAGQEQLTQIPELAANLKDCETVLDECTALLKSELHHSVYARFHLDQEILICLHEKRSEIRRKHLRVSLHLDPVSISGNSLWLKQVFETLFANAIDFCRPEGSLRITSRLNSSQIQIQFENTLDDKMASSVFSGNLAAPEAFRRYQTQRTGHFGIGHDLVRKVLKAHQGHLETRVDKGTFQATVLLPYSELDQYSR